MIVWCIQAGTGIKEESFKKTGKYYCEYIRQVINWKRVIGVKHHTCCCLSCSVVAVLVEFSSSCDLCLTIQERSAGKYWFKGLEFGYISLNCTFCSDEWRSGHCSWLEVRKEPQKAMYGLILSSVLCGTAPGSLLCTWRDNITSWCGARFGRKH